MISFLKKGLLPKDKVKVEKIHKKAPQYCLSEEQNLYKRSHLGPYLLCVHSDTVKPLLEELLEGICGSYTREGLYPIELSPRGINGRACRKPHKNMFGNAINVKDMPHISIS